MSTPTPPGPQRPEDPQGRYEAPDPAGPHQPVHPQGPAATPHPQGLTAPPPDPQGLADPSQSQAPYGPPHPHGAAAIPDPQGPAAPTQPQTPYAPPHPQGRAAPPPYSQAPYATPPHPQGPAAPYGPPYRPWGQGYTPYLRPTPVNALAITALVLGVLCFLPALGLVFGLIALWQIKKRGERGKGMAIGGAVLSGVGLALWALAIAAGGGPDFWVRDGSDGGAGVSVSKGECFDTPSGSLTGRADDVDKVSCKGGHDGEVFAVFRLSGKFYPGNDELRDTAGHKCPALQDGYAMDTWAVPDDVEVYYLLPTEQSWNHGDREIACVFGNVDAQAGLTGSLRNDATTLDADQVAYLKAAHVLNTALDAMPAKSPEADLQGNRRWAAKMAKALGEQAGLLRAHQWPAAARKPVTDLAKRLETAQGTWVLTATSPDADTFRTRYDRASALIDARKSVTARKALGLDTTPPDLRGSGGTQDTGGGETSAEV